MMVPGVNASQMKRMMKQMGIQQQDIEAEAVIIKTAEKDIIITNPSVVKVNMMGQESFQISGDISERENKPEISEEDIKTVMEQAGVDRDAAIAALEENDFDLAKAIMALSK